MVIVAVICCDLEEHFASFRRPYKMAANVCEQKTPACFDNGEFSCVLVVAGPVEGLIQSFFGPQHNIPAKELSWSIHTFDVGNTYSISIMLQQFYRVSLLNMCTLWSEITLSYRQKLLFEVVKFCCRHTPAFSLVENWFGIFLYRKFLLRVHVADMLNHGRTKNHTDIDNHTDIFIGLHLILIRTNQCCYDSSHWLDPSPTRVT